MAPESLARAGVATASQPQRTQSGFGFGFF